MDEGRHSETDRPARIQSKIRSFVHPDVMSALCFQPTSKDRNWFFHPLPAQNPWWIPLFAIMPALLATILIFMDQQITAVIVNRKENKLKARTTGVWHEHKFLTFYSLKQKGCGYHLDLLVVAILIAICSIAGLPWFVAATVLSLTHVNSLRMESESASPGEKPQFLGVREQRVTHIIIFVMVGVSVFLTQYLQFIPMPVLFGVFLYMGISSLKGSQMFARITIIFMPAKYQPDYIFLRQVPIGRVHLFTLIQVTCFACLWIVKVYKPTSIAFPLMVTFIFLVQFLSILTMTSLYQLLVMLAVRKLLDLVFTRRELKILDDVMPEHKRKEIEDMKNEEEDKLSPGVIAPSGSSGNMAIPLANGNILKIPLNPDAGNQDINISEQLAKSGAWKNIDQKNLGSKKDSPKEGKQAG